MKENADKIRALDATEMAKQLRDSAEQNFRLRFQLSMGQPDGLKKIRQLRKERARILTVQRERELGKSATPADSAKTVTAKKAAAKKAAAPKAPAKKAAVKKTAAPKVAAVKKAPAKAKKPAKG
jgi:large subunit ribosomal protein L29